MSGLVVVERNRRTGTALGCGLWACAVVGSWVATYSWGWPDALVALMVLSIVAFGMFPCLVVGMLIACLVAPAHPLDADYDEEARAAAGIVRRRTDREAVRR